jgi:hypothetical protein
MKRLLAILLVAGLGPSCGPAASAWFINLDLLVVTSVPDTFTIAGVASGDQRVAHLLLGLQHAAWPTFPSGSTLTAGSVRPGVGRQRQARP